MSPSRPRRSRRRTRTSLPSDEIRSRLYREALTRFRERGYEAVSVSDLTRETGVAKGTFFNHFPTKDHVLSAVHEEMVAEAVTEVSAEGLDGIAALVAVFELLAGGLEADRRLAALLFRRWSLLPPATPDGDPPGAHTSDELRERVGGWLDATLTFDLPVAEIDTGALSTLLVGAYAATVTEWAAEEAPPFPLVPTLRRRLVFLLRAAALPLP